LDHRIGRSSEIHKQRKGHHTVRLQPYRHFSKLKLRPSSVPSIGGNTRRCWAPSESLSPCASKTCSFGESKAAGSACAVGFAADKPVEEVVVEAVEVDVGVVVVVEAADVEALLAISLWMTFSRGLPCMTS